MNAVIAIAQEISMAPSKHLSGAGQLCKLNVKVAKMGANTAIGIVCKC